jgi:hypothetical protein
MALAGVVIFVGCFRWRGLIQLSMVLVADGPLFCVCALL